MRQGSETVALVDANEKDNTGGRTASSTAGEGADENGGAGKNGGAGDVDGVVFGRLRVLVLIVGI